MKIAEAIESEKLPVKDDNIVHLPLGLLGFESVKKYVLLSTPEEEPFLWLQVLSDPHLAFLVVSPFLILPSYRPELSPEDVEFLGLKGPEDALLYNVVTLRAGGQATVNLKGPVVLNRFTFVGKQAVLVNAAEYSLQHPMPVTS